MEPPSKSNNFDRLSDLPDSIFHHILSFLDIKQVAQVSTLSRRCRNICLSSPFLNVDLRVRDHKGFYRFGTFLHRYMALRNGVAMHQFKVICLRIPDDIYELEFHIGNWVLEATRCDVEKICLHLKEIDTFSLPRVVLNSASLRYLEVVMGPGLDSLLELPADTSFWGLESLKLGRMSVPIESFGEWISSCKSLKMLHLYSILSIAQLNISSSSLEKLILEDLMVSFDDHKLCIKVSAEKLSYLRIEYGTIKHQIHSLTLHAPKLEQFSWQGIVSHYSYDGSFESLSYSNLSILPCASADDAHAALANGIISKVLETIYHVSSLCISDNCIQVICVHQLRSEFCNLRSLTLSRTYLGDSILPRVFLLISMPLLNTLKIRWWDISVDVEKEKICYTAEYWESQNLEFVHSLKEVEMEIRGENNEIELIKYLLKNAESLKNMTILYPSALCRQSVIRRKIQRFQIASSAIALYFLQS